MSKHYRVLIPKFQTHGKPLKIEHLVTFSRFVVYKPADVFLLPCHFLTYLLKFALNLKKVKTRTWQKYI